MVVKNYIPYPGLQCFIKNIALTHYQLDKSSPVPVNPFPPQPYHTLYFYPYDKITSYSYSDGSTSKLAASSIVGPQLNRVDLQMDYNILVIIVNFKPCALYRLLKIPMHELIDTPLDAAQFLDKELETINEQLSLSKNYDEMVSLIQKYLLKKVDRLKDALPVDLALQSLEQNDRIINIDRLANLSCVSIRQLERQFNERIGMPPKLYFRLERFSKAWNLRETYPQISWSTIAHQCGYADQMHMIRDFKEFAGVTPGFLQTELEKTPLRLQRDGFDIL
ncbi:helix-turn-helix transcriptional regulator [Mucilaginibacter sp. BT774]|uniref:helix-turn-helix transcriptional regulator n=1 Tax=Mucilaginibacter sp. BT774 TaxID=3062276 RepID=UPI00267471E0|nr:helix-turn-helix transcriptional regulator [Mucilaginibacter sp. BT774]MDO3627636.1 helix-turn-helix transcriptional regulator [Mucilaginibacter sp. BT774]